MCGIAGIFNYKNSKPIDRAVLKSMCDVITHRGPDDQGIFIEEQIRLGLGHRRLSIIDLAGGIQPMSNARNNIIIVFNGEIYNYPELKAELQARGCVFKTSSDTEVIIYLYEQYGADSFKRLNGIFAFAIYDKSKKELVLARDHFGVKPLYYYLKNGQLIFGSEIKSILAADPSLRKIDEANLDSYLRFRYSPSPATLIKDVHKLYPGHYLSIDLQGNVTFKNFAASKLTINHKISFDDALDIYRQKLSAAVKRQMISDVPVGLFLSGGVDSAVLGYLMRQNYQGSIKTFTVGFAGKGDYNELDDARESAKFIGSEHHELVISKEEYFDYFLKSFLTTEEPIAETTVPALYYVAKLAHQQLKVVLAGQGADEPMAGYARYLGLGWISRYGSLLRLFPKGLTRMLPRNERFKRAMYVAQYSNQLQQIMATYTIFDENLKSDLYNNDFKQQVRNEDEKNINWLYEQTGQVDDLLSKILFIDTRMSLSDNLLLFNDKVTMANSLEMRVPFLDTDLIEFIESLPSSFKLNGFKQKYIHKEAVKKWLPDEIINRKKRGFQTPMDQWLQSDLGQMFKRMVQEPDSACRKYFNVPAIERMVDLHQDRRENYQRHIFLLFSFEVWHRTFLEGKTIDMKKVGFTS